MSKSKKMKIKFHLQSSIILIISFQTFSSLISTTYALRCYKCSSNQISDCENNNNNNNNKLMPPEETIVNCKPNQHYCTIRRNERNSDRGKAYSIFRNCEMRPHVMKQVITDDEYTTYFVACEEDLCNDGDGTNHEHDEEHDIVHKPHLPVFEDLVDMGRNEENKCTLCVYLMALPLIVVLSSKNFHFPNP
uniref:Uncharacterized protein n=1 Tax=Strigamia maritima TaxID=126957 RepID=T1IL06_STRMM